VTSTPGAGALPPSALQAYANAQILLSSNAIPGVLDSERTDHFLFVGFIKRLGWISTRENHPGLDTDDFIYEDMELLMARQLELSRGCAERGTNWRA
jgi:hypothetical protein